MRHRYFAVLAVAASTLALAAAPSLAQSQAPRPGQAPPAGAPPQRGAPPPAAAQAGKPYKPVTISAPEPVKDPSFEAFRKQIADAAQKKDRKAIAGLVVAQGFFWEGEKGDKADKRKPGIDNLARAISLDAKDGSGWETLAGYAADPTGAPNPEKKDTICAPADPNFNGEELEALAKATNTDENDWGYPTQPNVEMRASPQPNAPVVERLGMYFIQVVQENNPTAEQNSMLKVVAPSGKSGYVSADAISPLGNDQICYTKAGGAWKIAGFIGGEQ